MKNATSYELEFSKFLGAGLRSFAFWKGRVALFAILKALRIVPEDEIILPGFTCVVVPNAIRLAGARPVYVDIADNSYNIDPANILQVTTPNTRAIIVQHTFGIPACMDEIIAIARERNLYIIEDCAHALGSVYAGRYVGLMGDAAFFSTQWSKPFTTGLGGIAVTRDAVLAEKLEQVQHEFQIPPLSTRLRLQFQYWLYHRFFTPRLYWHAQATLKGLGHYGLFLGSSSENELLGQLPIDHEWLMPPLQQEHGLRQLYNMPSQLEARRKLGFIYDQYLTEVGWPTTQRSDNTILLRYPLLVNNKRELLDKARQARIELGSWFESPLHPIELKKHHDFEYLLGQCPFSELAAQQVVNLPMHNRITTSEARRIVNFLSEWAERPQHFQNE